MDRLWFEVVPGTSGNRDTLGGESRKRSKICGENVRSLPLMKRGFPIDSYVPTIGIG